MQCSRFRTALSARADGEVLPPGVTGPAVEEHLGSCAACRRFADGIERLRDVASTESDAHGGGEAAADALLARVRAETDGRTDTGHHGLGGTRAG
ncbi:zf-HC2 domain-containing protein [Streptomyces sp. NPDC048639]|uniref:zf-HC2 domain-containing protein n=1 Tax=Streptomyces sp. NPDC048639 TaxID=3365581 RepID=UPI00372485C3